MDKLEASGNDRELTGEVTGEVTGTVTGRIEPEETQDDDDPDFTELVVRQLRYHSWNLGYEFRGERPPLLRRCRSCGNGRPRCRWRSRTRAYGGAGPPLRHRRNLST